MASGDEKFNVGGVKGKMTVIEGYFSDFATTLSDINAFIQTNVNASIESAAFGDLGGKLLNIWDYNASTFNDFHENFDNWAQVVAIIAANNNQFAVDALATYRDNAGTLDGVQEAREYVAANNGVSNSGSNYGTLSNAAKSIIDSSIAQGSHIPDVANIFGGKTVKKDDGTIEYYDADGNLVSYYKDGIYYDKDGNEIGDAAAYRKWLEDNGYQTPKTGDVTITDENRFGGKTIEKPDGTLEFYDKDGKLIATKKGDKYYDADGNEIGDQAAYEKWLEDNKYETGDYVVTDKNDFGGKTIEKPDGSIEYYDADGNLISTYKDGKYYDGSGKEIGDSSAYGKWLEENGYKQPDTGQHGAEDPSQDSDLPYGVDKDASKETFDYSNGSYRDKYTNPDGSTVEADYDKDGNLKFERLTDENGVVTETIWYDENGNVKEKYEWEVEDLGDGVYKATPKHYVDDGSGNLVEDPDYEGTPTYEWNEDGHHHSTTDPDKAPKSGGTPGGEEPAEETTSNADLGEVARTTNSTDFANSYKALSESERARLRTEYNLTDDQQVEAFLVDTISTGVGSTEWQSRYNEMPTDAKIEYIDRYGGQVPSSIPQETSVDVRNQTYSSYDGSFLIKPDTGSVDTSMQCTYDWCNSDPAGRDVLMNNAQEIRKSGEALFGRLDSETATFTSTMNAVDNNRNLTAEQKETIKAYLQEQINARNTVSDTIKKDLQNDEHTYTLSNGNKTSSDDGIVGDWTHVNSDGSNKVGFSANYSYKQVEECVDKWQTNYNGLTDYDYTKAYLATYGIFI